MILYFIRKDSIEYLKRCIINILFIHIDEIKNIRKMQRENKTKKRSPLSKVEMILIRIVMLLRSRLVFSFQLMSSRSCVNISENCFTLGCASTRGVIPNPSQPTYLSWGSMRNPSYSGNHSSILKKQCAHMHSL